MAHYTHEIRVTWGDCDPARIVYTARLPAFALDAIDGFWEDLLGGDAGFFANELDRGFGTPFVHMDLDFRAPVTPRHRLICTVDVLRLGATSITFRVTGSQDGVLCWEGTFVCVFTKPPAIAKAPPPDAVRAAVEALLGQG